MQKKYLSTFLSLAFVFLLFTACEKEAVESNAVASVEMMETEASRYLTTNATALPFAVLEIDHTTNQVSGFFVDFEANLRIIDIENAPYLNLEDLNVDNYFMDKMYDESTVVEATSIMEVAAKFRTISYFRAHDTFTETEATTSKFYLLLKENLTGMYHRDCVGNANTSTGSTSKVVLAATGKFNYEATTEQEKAVVTWLQAFEGLMD